MLTRLLLTIATAASLAGLFVVYSSVVRPLATPVVVEIKPAAEIVPEPEQSRVPVENLRVAQTFLGDQTWAASSQYMFRAGKAFLYANDWELEKGSQSVRFTPFAMIWVQKNKRGEDEAVTLVSESAQLRFASKFDLRTHDAGRIVGAVLDGLVQVKGPDGLAIVGRRFIFDESAPSLVSTHPVQFQIDKHRGSGRSLHVALIPGEGLPGKDRPHVYGIRSLRLSSGTDIATRKFEYVRLDLQLKQNGKLNPIKIRCTRDLEYDVASQTAVFSKEVVAYQTTGRGPTGELQHDYIESDLLIAQLAKKEKKVGLVETSDRVTTVAASSDDPVIRNNFPGEAVTANGAFDPLSGSLPAASSTGPTLDGSDRMQRESKPGQGLRKREYQEIETELELTRLTAEGPVVKVVSHKSGLNARMTKLTYDIPQKQLWMTAPKGVSITQKGAFETKLLVPELGLQIGEDDSMAELICRGKGRLESKPIDSKQLAFIASWNESLRKSTDADTGLDLIELNEQASFRQPDKQTALGAERIRIWFAPIKLSMDGKFGEKNPSLEKGEDATLTEGGPGTSISPSRNNTLSEKNELSVRSNDVDVKRLSAEKDVALVSPLLIATTQELDVRFEEGIGPKAVPLRNRQASAGNSPRNASREHSDDELLAASEPIEMKADRIGVRLRKVEGISHPELVYAETHGNIEIIQKRAGNAPPLKASGDRMYLTADAPQKEIVHIFGNPAHLRDRGLHIEGRDVHLDRGDNRAWVKGHGLLQLPVPEDALKGLGSRANGDKELDVWWDESMEFDGKTAKFLGKVKTELGLARINCEQMDVELTSQVSFAHPKSDQNLELYSIECREDVTFENSEYEGAKLVQVARGRLAEFIINNTQDKVLAHGPGHMQLWQRGGSNQAGLAPRDVIQANRPITVVASDWDYTRIHFKGRMTGRISQQTSTFHDSVHITHGPVKRPNEVIDPDELSTQAGSMRCEVLEFTHKPKSQGKPKGSHQLVGRGNALIEGSGFYATADEISFDGEKDLYILRAYGKQNATIAQDVERGPRNEATGRRIEFIPSTRSVKVDQVSGVSGG